jgi:predicted amino acid-binding ACT domain protein
VEIAIKDPDEEMMPEPSDENVAADHYILTVTGPDQKGSLRQITRRLAQEGIDIVDLHGIRDEAKQRFSAFMELVAPPGVDVLSIIHELQASSMARNLLLTIQHRAILQATSRPEPPAKAQSSREGLRA